MQTFSLAISSRKVTGSYLRFKVHLRRIWLETHKHFSLWWVYLNLRCISVFFWGVFDYMQISINIILRSGVCFCFIGLWTKHQPCLPTITSASFYLAIISFTYPHLTVASVTDESPGGGVDGRGRWSRHPHLHPLFFHFSCPHAIRLYL